MSKDSKDSKSRGASGVASASSTSIKSESSISAFGYPQTTDPSQSSLVQLKSGDKTGFSGSSLDSTSDSPSNNITTTNNNEINSDEKTDDRMYTQTPRAEEPSLYRRRSVIKLDMKTVTKVDAPARFMGESTYRQSVAFLLCLACFRSFPNRELVIHQQFSFLSTQRSYYCRFRNDRCSIDDVDTIKKEMLNLIKMQIEIEEKYMLFEDCIQHFIDTKQLYSAKLAKTLNRSRYLVVGCKIDQEPFYSLSYRHLLGNTKHIHGFGVFQEEHSDVSEGQNDFILAFPNKHNSGGVVTKPSEAVSIRRLYLQGVKLGRILGVECVGDLNELIQQGKMKELILLSEAYHDKQIVNMAQTIATKKFDINKKDELKVVLISGPSSSGKTTFASKLCIQLKLLGINPVSMEVDMFYKDRRDPTHPRDDKGELNFEVIEAVRLKYLQGELHKLMRGETIKIPNFSFVDGHIHGDGEELTLPKENGILVMEGIFCLNPKLTNSLSDDSKFKVFMCPISFFNLDNAHFLSEQIVRLVRRVSRDHRRRNQTAKSVLFKWGQLQGGEDENIFPYVDACDEVFNSILPYEVPVLKVYSKPLLQTITPKEKQYKDCTNLLAFLDSFVTMPDSGIPSTSLIQEFMGQSIYDEL